MQTRSAIIGTKNGFRSGLCKFLLEHHCRHAPETGNDSCPLPIDLCQCQHGRYADAAAHQDHPVCIRLDREAMSQRRQHIHIIPCTKIRQHCGTFPTNRKHQRQSACLSVDLAYGDGAAQGAALGKNVYELTRCSNGRDLRALQYEPIQILTQIILADQPVFSLRIFHRIPLSKHNGAGCARPLP